VSRGEKHRGCPRCHDITSTLAATPCGPHCRRAPTAWHTCAHGWPGKDCGQAHPYITDPGVIPGHDAGLADMGWPS
jgi:hypothetical protein